MIQLSIHNIDQDSQAYRRIYILQILRTPETRCKSCRSCLILTNNLPQGEPYAFTL